MHVIHHFGTNTWGHQLQISVTCQVTREKTTQMGRVPMLLKDPIGYTGVPLTTGCPQK